MLELCCCLPQLRPRPLLPLLLGLPLLLLLLLLGLLLLLRRLLRLQGGGAVCTQKAFW